MSKRPKPPHKDHAGQRVTGVPIVLARMESGVIDTTRPIRAGTGKPVPDPEPEPTDDFATRQDLETPAEDFDSLTPVHAIERDISDALTGRTDMSQREKDQAIESATELVRRMSEHVRHAHKITTDRLLEIQQGQPGSEWSVQLLAELKAQCKDLGKWRLELTGVNDGNGRMGKLDRRVDDLEELLGELRSECGTAAQISETRAIAANVKGIRKQLIAAIAAAAVAIGGSTYGLLKSWASSNDKASRESARLELRLDHIERDLARLFDKFPFLTPAAPPAQPVEPPAPPDLNPLTP